MNHRTISRNQFASPDHQERWRLPGPKGTHRDRDVANVERRCHNAIRVLRDILLNFHDPTGGEHELNEALEEVEEEMNELERILWEMPEHWLQVWDAMRSEAETECNNHYAQFGIELGLPWGEAMVDTRAPKRDEWGQAIDEGRVAGVIHRDRGAATQAGARPQPGLGPREQQEVVNLLEMVRDAIRPGQRRNTHAGTAARNAHAAPALDRAGLRRRAAQAAEHRRAHPAPGEPPAVQTAPARAGKAVARRRVAANLPDNTERLHREHARESVNRDNTRFAGVVNAFKTHEDPLSRPLQKSHDVTIVDDKGNPLYVLHLLHGQKDEHSMAIIKGIGAEADLARAKASKEAKESNKEIKKPIDVATTAIEGGWVSLVTTSKKAGGDIWATNQGRRDIADLLINLETEKLGKWSLFGVGKTMSEGMLFLLQKKTKK